MARLYNDKRWHRMRTAHLRDNPLCVYCAEMGRTTPASVVDHITPHRGDNSLFFDHCNLQSLCKTCHDSAKHKAESRGVERIGSRADGTPIDPNHHWNKQGGG